MPFTIAPQQTALPEDFDLVADQGYEPTTEETQYLDALTMRRRLLARDAQVDARAAESQRVTAELRAARRLTAVRELRKDADKFCAGGLEAIEATAKVHVIWGQYLAYRARLKKGLFDVSAKIDPATRLATDVEIKVDNGLEPAPPDKQTLYVAIEAADTIIRTVCEGMERPCDLPADVGSRGQRLRDQYVRKLVGIARIGLEGPHTQLATLALDGLRREFVYSEAGRIKNRYLHRLAWACGVPAALMLLAYIVVARGWFTSVFLEWHQPFWLVAAGAALGTWASFSIRRQALNFDDLAILEDDMLEPWARVAFVLLLTIAISLLFWTNALQIGIGDLKTTEFKGEFKGSTAFLIGLFCGIAERTLATAVSARAANFLRGVSG